MIIWISDMSLYLWKRWILLHWAHILFWHLNRLILLFISHSDIYWCNLIIIKLWLWSGWTSWFWPLLFIHIWPLVFVHASAVWSWPSHVLLRWCYFSWCSAILVDTTLRPICCHVSVFLIFRHFWHTCFCLKSLLIILLVWILYINNKNINSIH